MNLYDLLFQCKFMFSEVKIALCFFISNGNFSGAHFMGAFSLGFVAFYPSNDATQIDHD